MTLKELNDWIESAKYVELANEDYDSSGNHYVTSIYKKDDKFYKIEFCNNHPYEKYISSKGFVCGEYDIKQVHRNSWIEYVSEWIENNNT